VCPAQVVPLLSPSPKSLNKGNWTPSLILKLFQLLSERLLKVWVIQVFFCFSVSSKQVFWRNMCGIKWVGHVSMMQSTCRLFHDVCHTLQSSFSVLQQCLEGKTCPNCTTKEITSYSLLYCGLGWHWAAPWCFTKLSTLQSICLLLRRTKPQSEHKSYVNRCHLISFQLKITLEQGSPGIKSFPVVGGGKQTSGTLPVSDRFGETALSQINIKM